MISSCLGDDRTLEAPPVFLVVYIDFLPVLSSGSLKVIASDLLGCGEGTSMYCLASGVDNLIFLSPTLRGRIYLNIESRSRLSIEPFYNSFIFSFMKKYML